MLDRKYFRKTNSNFFVKLPHSSKAYTLRESYHVYSYSDSLEIKLKQLVNKCISDLESGVNLVSITRIGKLMAHTLLPPKTLENINKINLFVGWCGDNPDISSAFYITTYEHEYAEGIIKHICSNHKTGKIKEASVILLIPTTYKETLERHGQNYFGGMLKHELMHLLDVTFSPDIAEKVGYAYAYGRAIVNFYNFTGIVDDDALKQIVENPADFSEKRLGFLMANLIYLLDRSETHAWLQSFDTRDYNAMKCDHDKIIPNGYNNMTEYLLYDNLYKAVKEFYNELCEPYHFIDPRADQFIFDYFKNAKNITLDEYYNLAPYIDNIWIPTLEKQLKKMQRIHFENMQKVKKEDNLN